MARIVLNGQAREIDDGVSVAALLEQSAYGGRRVAVEINREIVPKSQHAERLVRDGDRVEVVTALGGG